MTRGSDSQIISSRFTRPNFLSSVNRKSHVAGDGEAVVGPLCLGLAPGPGRASGGRHDGAALGPGGGRVVVLEEEGGQSTTDVPDDVIGQHAHECVGPDPLLQAVMDRAHLQVDGLEVPNPHSTRERSL
jgi:hypothetical protein